MQSRTDEALRQIILGKAPAKVKRECLASMEAPSASFLAEILNNDNYPPKLKLDAARRLAKVNEAKEARRILKQEIQRIKEEPKKISVDPPVQTPATSIAETKPNPIEPKNTAAEPIKTETIKAKPKPKPAAPAPLEGEFERRQYRALFAARFGRDRFNPSADPVLRQQCNPDDLAEIDKAYFQARAKIEAGQKFDNSDCSSERAVLRDWISTPGKGVDGLNRKTAEGKIADSYWDHLDALWQTVKNLPDTGD